MKMKQAQSKVVKNSLFFYFLALLEFSLTSRFRGMGIANQANWFKGGSKKSAPFTFD